ncbi:NADH-quinone oxidoreductase subunit G [Ignatzschineria ureiclastica]|uniref:NADH-quinone oxidoreductase n=1 Tax=Ignatzschineria ureiclastica TaxID=472582 RepID=A0A2U2AHF2_9GAMM|nr:NADH-quinone oxidoreductase subunit NuoG [Ignatzschineria ureiclastica]PWD82082.1 NADH-quinone oxidoreductase subunit G [Ignatzschineria ureiclastica]GGZ92551.1 NADH-quinone oxidoreductase [Ignatzschineria ureiclastica]
MSNEKIFTVNIDGKEFQAPAGTMLIEVADREGITIPRFCYHDKLSIAASCRMCLVDVERMPKPAPACATPIMDGMIVRTRSEKARAAQKAIMEFLLINHPLDCPICDQGGECELQDFSAEYGQNHSIYTEEKRHFPKSDIGPLVETFMNRCIQCTRCVRYGDEIAGMRELGGLDRGDRLEISTYIQHALASEVSANIIDICPVGALTAKPSKYGARPWEYMNHDSISIHDGVGTNTEIHTLRGKIARVVSRRNDEINEPWIADRDRFSYEALFSADRAHFPLIDNGQGVLEQADWADALKATKLVIEGAIQKYGSDQVGVFVSPLASVEELQLISELKAGLNLKNVDYRLKQRDFSGEKSEPAFRSLGLKLTEINQLDSVFLVGADPRMEVPVLAIRLRDAVKNGAKVSRLGTYDADQLHSMHASLIAHPFDWVGTLMAVVKRVATAKGQPLALEFAEIHADTAVDNALVDRVADQLLNGEREWIVIGDEAMSHPQFATIRALSIELARLTGASLGYFTAGANSSGAALTQITTDGFNTASMLAKPLKAYILVGAIDPEHDFVETEQVLTALKSAEAVVAITPFASKTLQSLANIILPAAAWAESSGSFVNLEGRLQSLQAASMPQGEARPLWKILRVLGNQFELPGFGYISSEDVLAKWRLAHEAQLTAADNTQGAIAFNYQAVPKAGLMAIPTTSIYSVDAYVRRGEALQKTPLASRARIAFNNSSDEAQVMAILNQESRFTSRVSTKVAPGCVRIPTEYAGQTPFYQFIKGAN